MDPMEKVLSESRTLKDMMDLAHVAGGYTALVQRNGSGRAERVIVTLSGEGAQDTLNALDEYMDEQGAWEHEMGSGEEEPNEPVQS